MYMCMCVLRKTGILVLGSRDDQRVKKYRDSLDLNNISYRSLTGPEASEVQGVPWELPGVGVARWTGVHAVHGVSR